MSTVDTHGWMANMMGVEAIMTKKWSRGGTGERLILIGRSLALVVDSDPETDDDGETTCGLPCVYSVADWRAMCSPTWGLDLDGELREFTSDGRFGRVVRFREIAKKVRAALQRRWDEKTRSR